MVVDAGLELVAVPGDFDSVSAPGVAVLGIWGSEPAVPVLGVSVSEPAVPLLGA